MHIDCRGFEVQNCLEQGTRAMAAVHVISSDVLSTRIDCDRFQEIGILRITEHRTQ